jgi:AcrR family transcriptional regulator
MVERGLPRITLREVAERAGVQPALVSYYFGGKTGLLRAVVADFAERAVERAAAGLAGPGTAPERLRAFLRAVITGLVEEPYGPRLVVEQVLFAREEVLEEYASRFARRHLELLRGVLEDGVAEGSFRRVDPMFLAPQLVGGSVFFFLSHPLLARLFHLVRITPEVALRFADHAADVVLRGICVPAEERR